MKTITRSSILGYFVIIAINGCTVSVENEILPDTADTLSDSVLDSDPYLVTDTDSNTNSDTNTNTDTDSDEIPDSDSDEVDGTDTDTYTQEINQPNTNLFWLRCPIGETWNGISCHGISEYMNWYAAEFACPDGFRLPTREEFIELFGSCETKVLEGDWGVCNSCSNSDICGNMFPKEDIAWYWSSTFYSEGAIDSVNRAWGAGFYGGDISMSETVEEQNVRCVRSEL